MDRKIRTKIRTIIHTIVHIIVQIHIHVDVEKVITVAVARNDGIQMVLIQDSTVVEVEQDLHPTTDFKTQTINKITTKLINGLKTVVIDSIQTIIHIRDTMGISRTQINSKETPTNQNTKEITISITKTNFQIQITKIRINHIRIPIPITNINQIPMVLNK